jgi:hypothetical protein
MDAWVRGVEAAMATDRRALCASAALQRAESPPVNLAGLDSAQTVRRRAACLNAALARFLAAPGPAAAAAAAAKPRGSKRQRRPSLVADALLQLAGGDRWSMLVCGQGHSLKRARAVMRAT